MPDVRRPLSQLTEIIMRQSMRRFILFLKGRGFSMSQMGTLMFLHRHQSCAVSDIGEYLGVTAAASSQLLNRLVDEGLIERQESPQDRRVKLIVLTPVGHQVIKESIQTRKSWLDQLMASLSEEEQQLVDAASNLLIEKISRLDTLDEIEKLHN